MEFLNTIWIFFQDQILGMKFLNLLIGDVLSVAGVDIGGRLGGSIQFFLYDVVKITILLCLLIFMISYIQSYFPPERSKKILGKFDGIGANVISALLGTVTPFCSCSSIPLFIGFTSAGLPLGVTFSFLISSPMVDLGSLVLLMSIFGAKVAAAYVILGLVIAVIGGTLIEKLHMEKYVEDFVKNARSVDISSPTLTKKDRVQYAKKQVIGTFKKVFPYILIGVGIGAVIHNWIPGKLDRECFGKSESFWCDFSNAGWNPDVCGYIRYNPCCRSFVIKRCRAGNNFIIYDGSNNIKSAVFDHAEKSCKTKITGIIYWDMHGRDYHCRLYF